jgi:hypothetical protein
MLYPQKSVAHQTDQLRQKDKIESTIKYLKNNFFNGRTFSDLKDLNNQCWEWLIKVNSQIHGTTHEIPYQRLKDEKLNPLTNVPPYMTRQENTRKISRDCYVSYKGNRYSVPWIYAGRECRGIYESSSIRIEVDSEIETSHDKPVIDILDHLLSEGLRHKVSRKTETMLN